MPAIISFIGKPDSGKTTLIEKLIPELNSRGYSIGVIKHHVHAFEFDIPGKDTWRHKKAGAHAVALASPDGLGLVRDAGSDPDVEETVARFFYDVDLVITEGYKRLSYPKIEIYLSKAHESPLADRDDSWVAFVSDQENNGELPWFNIDDIQSIAGFLVETFMLDANPSQATLLVDGKRVPLNSFVETFIRQSIIGMTSSLKGCRNPQEITVIIRNDPSEKD